MGYKRTGNKPGRPRKGVSDTEPRPVDPHEVADILRDIRSGKSVLITKGTVAKVLGIPERAVYQIPPSEIVQHNAPGKDGAKGRRRRWEAQSVAAYIDRYSSKPSNRPTHAALVSGIRLSIRTGVPMPATRARQILSWKKADMPLLGYSQNEQLVDANKILTYILEYLTWA